MKSNKLHILHTNIDEPERFTFPFNYIPHPLCIMAAKELQTYISGTDSWQEEIKKGKMFGVLVVRTKENSLGFLAAYSGLLGGRNDWEYFVPPIYDSQQPDGYFKTQERVISQYNKIIEEKEKSPLLLKLKSEAIKIQDNAEKQIAEYKEIMKASKEKRDAMRAATTDETVLADITKESQYQKAELRRMKKKLANEVNSVQDSLKTLEHEITEMKEKRKSMSDSLQQWLFEQYLILNAKGGKKTLCEIFADTPQGVPPSGAGDCCAPKLLQYAYENNLKPICMAEFWWGQSPKAEIRHHLHYYPACRSKCKPILGFMLQGLNVDPDPHDKELDEERLKIVYSDEYIIVVSKPSGILSMPGLVKRQSVVDILKEEFGEGYYMPAHRLDMDTSGLIVVARNKYVLRKLHEQFAGRKVKKRYAAILDGIPDVPRHGVINLPLATSLHNRPLQTVDETNGKTAITEYDIERTEHDKTYIKLFPHTGRTHQLRVHCAHTEGLATPILGDSLYGHPSASRMMLHAEYISFRHPATGKTVSFEDKLW